MGPTAIFTAYILGAYLAAGLLCGVVGEPLAALLQVPPHKIIGRGGLLLALIGFWPFLKALRLADRASLGYAIAARRFRRDLLLGLGLGMAILACLSAALWLLGIRAPDPVPHTVLIKMLVQGLLGGLAVAFIEETFFRGALQGAIRRRGGGMAAALLLPSLLYAALHFLKPQPIADTAAPGSCLASLGAGFPALFRAEHLDSFLALTLVGLFLGLVRERSGHLAWGIGLHAGWVLVIKLTMAYSNEVRDAPLGFLIGEYDGIIGWLASGWIGLLALGLALWPRRPGVTPTPGS